MPKTAAQPNYTKTSFTKDHTVPTVENSNFVFYDIESLSNIFTIAAYSTKDNHIFMFYLLDEDGNLTDDMIDENKTIMRNAIAKNNPALFAYRVQQGLNTPSITLHNLKKPQAVSLLIQHVLGGVNTTDAPHTFDPQYPNPDLDRFKVYSDLLIQHDGVNKHQIICDTHPDYDPQKHPFIMGYNSQNYDLTLLAIYIAAHITDHSEKDNTAPVTAAMLREHNDNMFSDSMKSQMTAYISPIGEDQKLAFNSLTTDIDVRNEAQKIYKSWINSGRHVDIARLNEVQARVGVGLKRLLGQMGHQILESDRLSGHNATVNTIDDIADLFAYNVSDVIGVSLLLENDTYSGSFDLRSGLLRTYPELVFSAQANSKSEPNINRTAVYPYRRIINSSSAQMAASILAPYRNLRDIPFHNADLPRVSFRYPAPSVAKKKGIERVNVLTALRDFVHENITDTQALKNFQEVYQFYRDIEGLNFNNYNDELNDVLVDIDGILEKEESLYEKFTKLFPEPSYIIRDGVEDQRSQFSLDELTQFIEQARDAMPDNKKLHYRLDYLEQLYSSLHDSLIPFNPEDTTPIVLSYPPHKINTIESGVGGVAERDLNLPYVDGDGKPTSCFATFSTGGIHGAEYNQRRYDNDNTAYQEKTVFYRYVIDQALQQIDEARQKRDAGKTSKKINNILDEVDAWVVNPESKNTKIADQPTSIVHDYTEAQQTAAAMWIRANVRIDVPDPQNTEQSITVEHGDAIVSTCKRSNPMLRPHPKNVKATELFKPKTSQKEPEYPPQSKHQATKLNPTYTYTSVGDVIHEDFTSYYPLLLINMAAFNNPDLATGDDTRDRYHEIFLQKEKYGRQMKDPSISDAERSRLKVLRQGTKLVLNAASGAADASNPTKILMNNRIITMRLIGQMFSWRIGQAQSLADALIVSTNTDGLYSVLDEETNNRILNEQAEIIGVDIEPEPLTLVSKDSNNRIEYFPAKPDAKPWERDICASGGSDLACATGPTPTKSITHPVLFDYVLAEYFKYIVGNCVPESIGCKAEEGYENQPVAMDQPMNTDIVWKILNDFHHNNSPAKELSFYQNVIAASAGKHNYPYAIPYTQEVDNNTGEITVVAANDLTRIGSPRQVDRGDRDIEVIPIQHYNRLFIVDPNKVEAAGLSRNDLVTIADAKAAVVNSATLKRRMDNHERPTNKQPAPKYILETNGENVHSPGIANKDITVSKHTGIDPRTPLFIYNHAIYNSADNDTLVKIIDSLDKDAYVSMIKQAYDKNWRNYV